MKLWLKRLLPLGIIIILMIIAYTTGAYKILTFERLRASHQILQQKAFEHPFLTPLLFIILYAMTTALSLPGGIFLSLLGGFLFPQPWCMLYVLIGATIGATCIFLAARTAISERLFQKAGQHIEKMRIGFAENAASYLLFLRFVPIFPFWLVNLAAAAFHVKLSTFIWTTAVGILPGVFVYTQTGRGLGAIFETNEPFSVKTIFNTQMIIALVSLAIISLIPIFIKKWKNRDRQPP